MYASMVPQMAAADNGSFVDSERDNFNVKNMDFSDNSSAI